MQTKTVHDFKEVYIRGPHLKYLATAIAIALAIVISATIGFALLMQLVQQE